jgi:hypothetical protein
MLPMPRFFFNARDGSGCRTDCEGRDILDLDAARFEALKIAKELWGSRSSDAPREILSLEITDETHHRLMIVPFHSGLHC